MTDGKLDKIPNLSVVMPTYNEEELIERVLWDAYKILKEICEDFEIIVVNDGSKDKTEEILKKLEEQIKELKLISYYPNKGYANALREGFKLAKFQYIFYTDSDGQFDINEIKNFFPLVYENDMVAGYRIKRNDPFIRKLTSKVYNLIQRFYLGIKVKDINCAFKIFKAQFLKSIPLISENFLIDAEFFLRAKEKGAKFAEVPVNHFERKKGKSTVKFYTIFQTLKEIKKLKKTKA